MSRRADRTLDDQVLDFDEAAKPKPAIALQDAIALIVGVVIKDLASIYRLENF